MPIRSFVALFVCLAFGATANTTRADLIPVASVPQSLGTFDIAINAGSSLSSNQAALDSFNRAAAQWENRISDSITVNIAADLSNTFTNNNIIGSTSSVALSGGFDLVANAMRTDEAAEASKNAAVAVLPTMANFSALTPTGVTLNKSAITANKANFKALGFGGLDTQFGSNDATITFNSNFNFDYDNRDGVTPGMTDFETVASHEIGHALGFVSAVDNVDGGATTVSPYTFDLFRFTNNAAGSDPSNTDESGTGVRDLRPGVDSILDDGTTEYRLSTGFNQGDGRQASHWKADELTGVTIGNLDPTLAAGVFTPVAESDLWAMDIIGYNVSPVPEPSTWAMMGIGLAGLAFWRRRRRAA